MHVIQLDRVTINHAGRVIFSDLSWSIGDRDRIGLVGPNGAGKSSLLHCIFGTLQPDAGAVVKMRGLSIGYLRQDVRLPPNRTVWDEAMILPPALAQIEAELSRIEASLADPDVYNQPDALSRVLARQEKALEEYERLGGPRHANRVRELLTGAGFHARRFHIADRQFERRSEKAGGTHSFANRIARYPALGRTGQPP